MACSPQRLNGCFRLRPMSDLGMGGMGGMRGAINQLGLANRTALVLAAAMMFDRDKLTEMTTRLRQARRSMRR